MSRAFKLALVLALGFGVAAVSDAAPWSFGALPPGGAVAGPPGSIVGWGYEVGNPDASWWLVLTGLDADPFAHGTPDGTIFDFPILEPGASRSVPFDPVGLTGLFQLTWDATAPAGFANSGTFVLHADWYDGDPLTGGSFVERAPEATAAYSATVEGAGAPEPGSTVLLLAGLTGLAAVRNRD